MVKINPYLCIAIRDKPTPTKRLLGSYKCNKNGNNFLNEINNGITLEYFTELVERMRHHQRRYFATGNQEILIQSKILEQRVDLAIEKLKNRG